MARIQRLGEEVANQIAAGEVVERPASVVRELLDNALDAGARRIVVAIEGGGRRSIRVEDDGAGIHPDDVALAFERHATSKISSAHDLARITSLGFRGEALPSIAGVGRVLLRTLARGATVGTAIEVAAGKVLSLEPVAFAQGTTVEIHDLFFNLPARAKFLKSAGAETAQVSAVVTRAALARPGVHFVFSSNGTRSLDLPGAATLRERVGQILGHDLARSLLEVGRDAGGLLLSGLAGTPDRSHPTRAQQHLFVNSRPVADRALQHAVLQGYAGLLPPSRFPAVFAFLEVDPALVDVNVHPAKSEVRFADPRALHALVSGGIREALHRGGFIPEARAAAQASGVREAVLSFLPAPPGPGERTFRIAPAATAAPSVLPLPWTAAASLAPAIDGACSGGEPAPAPAGAGDGFTLAVLGQFRNCFIVAADAKGLLLLDQHTAHERVLFEQLRGAKALRAAAQAMLLPEVVELPPGPAAALAGLGAELLDLGVEVEPLDARSFAVRALPSGMRPGQARRLLLELAEALAADDPRAPLDLRRDRALATIACHSAVQNHMPLETAKMEWLVAELFRCADPYRCPHGRAVVLRFDEASIRRSFGRYW